MITIEGLRMHQAQLIRSLDDAVTMEAHSTMYMLIGKLVMVQNQIEALEIEGDRF